MKKIAYLDFIELFHINDRQKAKEDWYGLTVRKSGVTILPQDGGTTPLGDPKVPRSVRQYLPPCWPGGLLSH